MITNNFRNVIIRRLLNNTKDRLLHKKQAKGELKYNDLFALYYSK